jgi:leucyl/phenylalanyl-tRNA---protein transferase
MRIVQFPRPELADENGLLAVGGDLAPDTLFSAYSQGIFPWPIEGIAALTWFSPPSRGIICKKDFQQNRSFQRSLRDFQKNRGQYTISLNSHFREAMTACSRAPYRASDGTWITEDIINAYTHWHQTSPHPWSFEICNQQQELLAALYGVQIGHYVAGESMMTLRPGLSKIALYLVLNLIDQLGVPFLDTQVTSPIVAKLGGRDIPRKDFLAQQKILVQKAPLTPILHKSLPLKNLLPHFF